MFTAPPLNDTKIDVVKGEIFSFSAKGIWIDWFIPCGPNGFFIKKILSETPVLKGHPFFKLCGCIDQNTKTAFPIGHRLEKFEMKHSGRLYLFANDTKKYYNNNFGSITVKIEKLILYK